MAAAARAKPTNWASHEEVTSTQLNTVDTNAAGGVQRTSSHSGAKSLQPVYLGTEGGGTGAVTDVVTFTALGAYRFHASGSSGADGTAHFALLGLPHGHTLNSVTISLVCASHVSAPATTPKITVSRHAYGTASSSTIGTAAHSGTAGTYAAGFSLAAGIATAAQTVDLENYTYTFKIRNESGANSKGGMILRGLQANVTLDTASSGADFTFWK